MRKTDRNSETIQNENLDPKSKTVLVACSKGIPELTSDVSVFLSTSLDMAASNRDLLTRNRKAIASAKARVSSIRSALKTPDQA